MIHVIARPNKPSGMVMTLPARYSIALLCCLFVNRGIVRGESGAPTTLRFAVTVAAGLGPDRAFSGRLLVVLGRSDGGEPRLHIGQTGMNAAPILARDVATLAPGKQAILDDRSIIFPIEHLGDLRPRHLRRPGDLAHQPRSERAQCARRSLQSGQEVQARPRSSVAWSHSSCRGPSRRRLCLLIPSWSST